ncbi:hypothetical protein KM043_008623 [Ampulex compressa]|nr:hypothetical protein KM043_008623 [Ampulex compressa]
MRVSLASNFDSMETEDTSSNLLLTERREISIVRQLEISVSIEILPRIFLSKGAYVGALCEIPAVATRPGKSGQNLCRGCQRAHQPGFQRIAPLEIRGSFKLPNHPSTYDDPPIRGGGMIDRENGNSKVSTAEHSARFIPRIDDKPRSRCWSPIPEAAGRASIGFPPFHWIPREDPIPGVRAYTQSGFSTDT